MEGLLMVVPVLGIVALLFAAYVAAKVNKQDAGTDRMKEIAAAINDGAKAFLTAEYKILVIFVAVLFVLIGIGIGNWVTAICFVIGALFSTAAGYAGMMHNNWEMEFPAYEEGVCEIEVVEMAVEDLYNWLAWSDEDGMDYGVEYTIWVAPVDEKGKVIADNTTRRYAFVNQPVCANA